MAQRQTVCKVRGVSRLPFWKPLLSLSFYPDIIKGKWQKGVGIYG
jgi:hypothetical protein